MAKKTTRTTAKTSTSTSQAIPAAEILFRRPRPKPPKLTDAAIKRAGKQLGVKLPAAYLNLMRQQNGGYLRLTAIKPKQRPPRFHTDRTVYEFENIIGIHSRGFDNLVSDAETAHTEWDVPPLLIPFDGDGHWWLCLDYRRCGHDGEPCITHFEPAEIIDERPKSCRIADCFEDLLQGLQFDAAEELLFAIDEPELLEGDLAKRLRSLGCRVERAKGESTKSPPNRWQWPQFDSSLATGKATLNVSENGTDDAWHLARPAWHPLLHVDVSAKDQNRCARLIHDEFGKALSLIHVPIDRRPPRGVPLEVIPANAKPQPRKKSAPVQPRSTTLNAAVLANDVPLVKELLDAGMKPDKAYGTRFSTALEIAASQGSLNIFKILLDATNRKPAAKLLDSAISGGNAGIIKLLLNQSLLPTTQHLHTAICRRYAPAAKLLISRGAKPNSTCLRHAAGITRPSEIGFPDKPHPAIMKLMRAEGKRAAEAQVRSRFEALK